MIDSETHLAPEDLALIDGLVQHKVEESMASLECRLSEQRAAEKNHQQSLALIVFSGDLDKLLAAFTLATSAASMGMSVSMFFTFWGLMALKRGGARGKHKAWPGKLMGALLPCGTRRAHMSKMNCFGMGPWIIRYLMRRCRIASLEELITSARELNVRFVACSAVMELMCVDAEDMLEGVEYAGAAKFLGSAVDSSMTLFI